MHGEPGILIGGNVGAQRFDVVAERPSERVISGAYSLHLRTAQPGGKGKLDLADTKIIQPFLKWTQIETSIVPIVSPLILALAASLVKRFFLPT